MTSLAVTLRELLDVLEAPLQRHPIVRSGERDPIPTIVRLSILLRDGFRCRECGNSVLESGAELDHMLPWSAGGSDDSANLRTLCSPCNQRRSNWDDGAHLWSIRPTTWWCWNCWRPLWIDDPEDNELEPPASTKPTWRDGTDLSAVPRVQTGSIQAYCASCQTYGWTDSAFTAADQRRLVELCTTHPHAEAATTTTEGNEHG